MRWSRRLQIVAVALLLIAYAGLSHYSNSNPEATGLATMLAIAPMMTVGGLMVWRWNGPIFALLLIAVMLLVLHR